MTVWYFTDRQKGAVFRMSDDPPRAFYANPATRVWVEDWGIAGVVDGTGGDGKHPIGKVEALALLRSFGGQPDDLDRSSESGR